MDTKLVRVWRFRVFCIVYICICIWVGICILCSSKRVDGHKACQRAVFASLALPTLKLVPLLSPPTRNTEHHIEEGSTNSTDINIVDLTIMSEVNVVQNIRAALHK